MADGPLEVEVEVVAGAGVGQQFSPWKTFWEKRRKSSSSRYFSELLE